MQKQTRGQFEQAKATHKVLAKKSERVSGLCVCLKSEKRKDEKHGNSNF